MTGLMEVLFNIAAEKSKDQDVAVLLSGGLDSLSVALAADRIGKRITAYTFVLDGFPSDDARRATIFAHRFGWPIKCVEIATEEVRSDFLRLAQHHLCRKKVHFEVTFPMANVIPAIAEAEILTGWNADDHYGNTSRIQIEFARLRKEGRTERELKDRFDELREASYRKHDDPESDDTFWFANRIAVSHGKRLIDPYMDVRLRALFAKYSHDELSSPKKPLVRNALRPWLRGMSEEHIASGIKLQKGGSVDTLFAGLLDDPIINRFETRYAKMSPLYMRWAKEIERDVGQFQQELDALPTQPASVICDLTVKTLTRDMASVRLAAGSRNMTAISFFAGAGGSSLGLRLAGAKVLAANEFVGAASDSYRANFPDTHVDRRDIRELLRDPSALPQLLNAIGVSVGELDILDGSPPCKNFSNAGNGVAEYGLVQSYSDRRQSDIASLPLEFAEMGLRIQPKVIIMENVPEIATRGKEILVGVKKMLGQAYFVNNRVLSASDYGVPQKRRRLFLFGVRKDVGGAVGIDSDDRVKILFPIPTRPHVTIRDAFVGLKQSAADLRPWVVSATTSQLGAAAHRLPKSPAKLTRPLHVNVDDTRNFTLTRCSWDRPAPTLTVTGQQPTGLAGAIHPEEDRKFTLPELKRLTALPDDFVLTGTVAQAAERICRMVPPPLTQAIAERIYERVLRPYAEKMK